MRMKVHLGILLLIGSLLAQPGPGMGMDGPPPGKNIEAMRIWRLTEVLELNEDQVTTFIPLLQIQERKIRDLQDEIDKLGNAGYELLQQEKVSQKEVDKLMQKYLEKHAEMNALRADFLNSLSRHLTPEQQLKFIGFESRFRNDLKNYMKERRGTRDDARFKQRP